MKNNVLNTLLLFIIVVLNFIFNKVLEDGLTFIMSLLFSATIAMFYKRKDIKNKLYNIISDLLLVTSVLALITLLVAAIQCIFNVHCSYEFTAETTILLFTSLLTLLFINIIDINKTKTKLYNILVLFVNIIVLLIYLRYYFDNSFIHNYIYINELEMQHAYIYIYQNYIYFNILYISLLIGYFINKNN